jgi:hypothetical protein
MEHVWIRWWSGRVLGMNVMHVCCSCCCVVDLRDVVVL